MTEGRVKKKKPTVKLVWNEAYWNDRAEEARTIGQEIRNPECKRIMRDIADTYDRLATLTKNFQKASMMPHSYPAGGDVRPKH
jgi:hypothetical protein